MQTLLQNWKTSLAGAIVIALGALDSFAGVHVPGAVDFAAALPIGLGLILAQDASAFTAKK